ncbi:hypothetical protein [Salinicola rhizosphaerae]|nr:hypothetical protein [Salinicola rhizosphaerae]
MHNALIPVVAIALAALLIFGGEAISESHVDDDISALIAKQQPDAEGIELRNLKTVQKGYGTCGEYRASGSDAYAPFYYSKVNERVTLDTTSFRYRNHCQH